MITRDMLARAGHTFWQAFVAALAVAYAASGLDVSQVTDLDSAKRLAGAALAATVAAALSAGKTTLASLRAARGADDPAVVAAVLAELAAK